MVCATTPSCLGIFTVMTDEILAQGWLLTFDTVQLSDKREEIRTELYDSLEVAIEIKRSMKNPCGAVSCTAPAVELHCFLRRLFKVRLWPRRRIQELSIAEICDPMWHLIETDLFQCKVAEECVDANVGKWKKATPMPQNMARVVLEEVEGLAA